MIKASMPLEAGKEMCSFSLPIQIHRANGLRMK
jgi:hypothetical protein